MVKRVKYTCKNCGWQTSIREEWGDIRPKRCMNKKCNTSFLASPESLVIDRPKKEVVKPTPKSDKKSNEDNNGTKSKKSGSRKTVKQQNKKEDSEQHQNEGE